MSLFLVSIIGLMAQTEVEAAIKKVIEQETAYFYARDFDGWASCYVQSPITYFSWISPSANKGSLQMVQGWEKVSSTMKAYLAKYPKRDNPAKKTDYQFRITDNMAFVTFKENNNDLQTRVLEKVDGKWKILRNEVTSTASFQKFQKLYNLQRMAGNWEVDMSTHKESEPIDWKLIHGESIVKDVPTGIQVMDKSLFRLPDGELRTSESTIFFTMNMATNTIGAFNSTHYPQSNWTRAYQAEGDMDENGKLTMTAHEIGTKSKEDITFSHWFEGDRLCYKLQVKAEGKIVYTESHQMKRKGLVAETTP